jgi:hypothetical protein
MKTLKIMILSATLGLIAGLLVLFYGHSDFGTPEDKVFIASIQIGIAVSSIGLIWIVISRSVDFAEEWGNDHVRKSGPPPKV